MFWIIFNQGRVDSWLIRSCIVLVGAAIFSSIIVLLNGSRVICPLCRAPLLTAGRALVKPRTKHICGSHKTRVALTLGFYRRNLDCPYCAEKVRLRS